MTNESPTPTELLDSAYTERSAILAWVLSSTDLLIPGSALIIPAPDTEPGWFILYARTRQHHQVSWHIGQRDLPLFDAVEQGDPADPRAQWDGHTTAAKYLRIRDEVETNNQRSQPSVEPSLPPDLPQAWISTFEGVGEHEFREVAPPNGSPGWTGAGNRIGPFYGMMEALTFLRHQRGIDWVEQNIQHLVASVEDGSIAWVTDTLGYAISRSPKVGS